MVELEVRLDYNLFFLDINGKKYSRNYDIIEAVFGLLDENIIEKLILSGYGENPDLFTSIIEKASNIESIKEVDVSNNYFKVNATKIAKILAKSESIQVVNMDCNHLQKHAPLVAKILSKSKSIHTISLSDNWIEKKLLNTAKALMESSILSKVDLSANGLDYSFNKQVFENNQRFFQMLDEEPVDAVLLGEFVKLVS